MLGTVLRKEGPATHNVVANEFVPAVLQLGAQVAERTFLTAGHHVIVGRTGTIFSHNGVQHQIVSKYNFSTAVVFHLLLHSSKGAP